MWEVISQEEYIEQILCFRKILDITKKNFKTEKS